MTNAVYIIDNGIDVRMVADDNEFCNIGRIEFYDGVNWGSFSDCSMQFTNNIASSFCQTLGWDKATSFNHGPYQNNMARTNPEYLTYTNIYCPASELENKDICDYNNNDHNELSDCDICVNCQLSNNFDAKCSKNTSISRLHSMYDIYLICSNEENENNPLSNLFNCTYYEYGVNNTKQIYDGNEWHLDSFESCSDAFIPNDTDQHNNTWKVLVVAAILILTIICTVIYVRSTKRMKHRQFTDAYMMNLENDNDIMLESTSSIKIESTSTIKTSTNWDKNNNNYHEI